jgi:hypothetical protein
MQGLIFDLVFWFFDHYSFSNSDHFDDKIDGYCDVLILFFVHIGRHILRYKCAALHCGYDHTYDKSQIEEQILSAVLCRPEIKKEFARQVSADQEEGYYSDQEDLIDNPPDIYDMAFDFTNFTISKHQHPASNSVRIANFVIEGQTLADKHFSLVFLVNFIWTMMVQNLISYSVSKLITQQFKIQIVSQHDYESTSKNSSSDRHPAKILKRHHKLG